MLYQAMDISPDVKKVENNGIRCYHKKHKNVNEKENEYLDFEYLSSKSFMKYERRENNRPVVKGYVSLEDDRQIKRKKIREDAPYVCFQKARPFYYPLVKEQLNNLQVMGYIQVSKNSFVQVKRSRTAFLIPFFGIWTALLLFLFIYILSSPTGTITEKENKEKNEGLKIADASDWDGSMPKNGETSKGNSGEIEIPGYSNIIINESHPNIDLINPSSNDVYFVYQVALDGDVIYQSDAIAPGKMLSVPANGLFDNGEYNVQIRISCYDVQTQTPCNGATQEAVISVG